MLIRFIAANFRSFREPTEFNMLTGEIRRLPHHVHKQGKLELLKVAALYGPNGSGKSNFVKGLDVLQMSVIQGGVKRGFWQPFKLDRELIDQPSHLEVEILTGKKTFLYGLELHGNRVAEEWLYQTHPGSEKQDSLLFTRVTAPDGKTTVTVGKNRMKTEKDRLRITLYEQELLRPDQVLLTMLHQSQQQFLPEAAVVFGWFERLMIVFPQSRPYNLQKFIENHDGAAFAQSLISAMGVGIAAFELATFPLSEVFGERTQEEVEKIKSRFVEKGASYLSLRTAKGETGIMMEPEGNLVAKRLHTQHQTARGDLVTFDLTEESDGTLRLIDYLQLVEDVIFTDCVYVVDEMDRSIHTVLLHELLRKLLQQSLSGQLIFTSHDIHLQDQDIFRLDELWMVDKKQDGSTIMHPLSDFMIRQDQDIQKGYLSGRFEAIPYLGELKSLSFTPHAQQSEQSL